MRLFYCALLTALLFPLTTWWSDPRALTYLTASPAFTVGFGAVLAANAVAGYLLAPWINRRLRLPQFSDAVAGELMAIAQTALLAGTLFYVECYIVVGAWHFWAEHWTQLAALHFVTFRIPVFSATVLADVLSGPVLFTHLYRVLCTRR